MNASRLQYNIETRGAVGSKDRFHSYFAFVINNNRSLDNDLDYITLTARRLHALYNSLSGSCYASDAFSDD
jgi:hypothetical protein